MKLLSKNKFVILFVSAVIFSGVLCSCVIMDVSHDPKYNYGYKYNHVYKTIDEALIHKPPGDNLYFLHRMPEKDQKNIDKYLSPQGRYVLLPKGTLFRVERLKLSINPENPNLFVEVKILNGHFKNTKATCFIDKYTDPVKKAESHKELWVTPEIPDPAVVVDLGEMPEYKDENLIPEPEPITYAPVSPTRNRNQRGLYDILRIFGI